MIVQLVVKVGLQIQPMIMIWMVVLDQDTWMNARTIDHAWIFEDSVADNEGNTYFIGKTNGNSITFGSITVNPSSNEFFVAKLNANHTWEWATLGGGNSHSDLSLTINSMAI